MPHCRLSVGISKERSPQVEAMAWKCLLLDYTKRTCRMGRVVQAVKCVIPTLYYSLFSIPQMNNLSPRFSHFLKLFSWIHSLSQSCFCDKCVSKHSNILLKSRMSLLWLCCCYFSFYVFRNINNNHKNNLPCMFTSLCT